MEHGRSFETALGLLALLFWSSTIAFSRTLTETLGTLTAPAAIFLISGLLASLCSFSTRGSLRRLARLSPAYLVGCGGLFVLYMVSLYAAIGLASNRQQVIEVGLVNYLWPGLTVLLSVPLLQKKPRASLPFGVLIAFGGVVLATAQGRSLRWEVFVENLRGGWPPYLLALVAALCWALYSNLSRRWAARSDVGAVPLFLLVTGCVLMLLRFLRPEQSRWTGRTVAELLYMAVFPTTLGYIFWDAAMRRGRIILLASVSHLTPLFSTLISSLYLEVVLGLELWIGCLMVIAGAVLCKLSIVEGREA